MKKFNKNEINAENLTTCSRRVDISSKTGRCGGFFIKNGRTNYGKQRLVCRICRVSKVDNPKERGFGNRYDAEITILTKEGMGIRSIGRILGISPSTVVSKILKQAEKITEPKVPEKLDRIQVDEVHTFIQNKDREIYVIYSWSQELKRVLSLTVGTRSKVNLRKVVNPLLEAQAETINTDKYSGYKGIVPKKKHTTFKRRNNGIERQNLNLRTHLKRLNRRTICFSKSALMLEAVLKIYCWA